MTPNEIATVFKKPGHARLELFVKTVATKKLVYGISDDEGWALLGDDEDDTDILPLFQAPELAEAFRVATGFTDSEVEEVDYEELMIWLDELDQDGIMVAVCPNTEFEGSIVEPADLKQELKKV